MESDCKKGCCTLEQDADQQPPRPKAAEKSIPNKEAEKVARDWFRWAGKRSTKAQIERAVRHPKVIAEAERRAAVMTAWLGKKSN